MAALGLPIVTVVLVGLRSQLALESVLLLYLLAVVLVAVIGGILPAVVAAVLSVLLANYFFTPPFHTLFVEQRDSVVALVVFVLVALTVSITVDLAARRRVAAVRSGMEAQMLSDLAARPVTERSLEGVLEQVRETFAMTSVALLVRRGEHDQIGAIVGPPLQGHPTITAAAGPGLRLVAEGPELFAEDRGLLNRFAIAAARAWDTQQLAGEARGLAEVDRLRTALLAAVGHDLRTPLAGIKAAVSTLRQKDITWSEAEQAELYETIEDSADRLDDLISNLLAMSRLQAGALSVDLVPTALDEVVARALIHVHGGAVQIDVPDDLPLALIDAGLLERVIANLFDNARRYSPPGAAIQVHGSAETPGWVVLRIADSGPGVAAEARDRMFAPFQRLDDRSAGGVGLGLALARGFTEAMGGRITPSETPGGGLTMTLSLPAAP
ncbi:phospho-acceptor domain-containing protein [Kribbella pratensis]|uniref:histidine kinase n=1 Tax=Kribbella pratensis TaxID=2512112 RepID=A0ABY2FR40_9ACTN|nr:phospho-acceptor domain-containing protein [Kribbella pratensis]